MAPQKPRRRAESPRTDQPTPGQLSLAHGAGPIQAWSPHRNWSIAPLYLGQPIRPVKGIPIRGSSQSQRGEHEDEHVD